MFNFEANLALVGPKDVVQCSDLYYLLEGNPRFKLGLTCALPPVLNESTRLPRGKRERATLFLKAACVRLVQLSTLDEVKIELRASEHWARLRQQQREEMIARANRGENCESCGEPIETPAEEVAPRRCQRCETR
jgi:hypothetical protein